eukprot:TRINITY_DN15246_c0_g3_i1.p1 TRINITY_DN15246_c0_g3~~TRINITY_DN15246_c0_g3_i1.p1  ORF type:complete len:992 (+),score=108.85 TRINITY_DN15246_c0_g3_i1:203-2977(+)
MADKFVAESMTRDFPHIMVSQLQLPRPDNHEHLVAGLRWKYGPDVMRWGSAADALLKKDYLMDLRGVFQEIGLASVLKQGYLKPCTGEDGVVYCAPMNSIPWWVIYARSAFEKISMSPPKTFNALIESCKKLRNVGIIPLLLPWKSSWSIEAFWDILNMRTNGAIFHRNVSLGKVPFTNRKIFRTFENWQRMMDARCFPDNMFDGTLSENDVKALWMSNQVAMIFIGDWHRKWILNMVPDKDDIDVMPFPTVTEGVDKGEIIQDYVFIVRNTTQQIHPVSVFLSKMLSREALNASATSGTMYVSPRKDFDLPRSRWLDRRDMMLSEMDVRLTISSRIASPQFLAIFKPTLLQWAATSTNSETIQDMLRTFESGRQQYFENRYWPPTITQHPSKYGGIEVELNLLGQQTQTVPIILFSINNEDLTEHYTMPVKLQMPGDYILWSKVVGERLRDSTMVEAKFHLSEPADIPVVLTVFAWSLSILAICFIIITVGVVARRIYREFALRRQHKLSKKLANEQLVLDAHRSTLQLNFPMALICAERFLTLSSLPPFESVSIANLVILHSISQAYNFKSSRKILFLSHQWLGFPLPDPDSLHIGVMKNAVDHAVKLLGMGSDEVYVWIDYICIPQVNRKMQEMAITSLVTYISLCDVFIIVAPECVHSDSNLPCDEATYRSRGWCRAELLIKILTSGFGNVYIARSDCAALETVGRDDDISSLNIFEGDFTCCSRKHARMLSCDREKMQNALIGLYAHLLLSYKVRNNVSRCESILKAETSFRLSLESSSISNRGETTTVSRSLFGDLVEVCRELVLQRPEAFSSSAIATVDRESPSALRWVPGTYRIIAQMSVYATPELAEQEEVSQPLCRGSIVEVLAIHDAIIDNTIVGQVDYPDGWIRLCTADFSVRWAELIDEADNDEQELTTTI